MLTTDEKKAVQKRLSLLLGQVEAVGTMIDEDEPMKDVVQLLKTCTGSLKGVARLVMEIYLRSLVKQLVLAKSTDAKNRGVEEVMGELIKSAELFPGSRIPGLK